MEGEEKKRLGHKPPTVTSDEETWPTAGAALPGWQFARNGGDTCLRERKREARVSVSAGREGESWVGGQRRNK